MKRRILSAAFMVVLLASQIKAEEQRQVIVSATPASIVIPSPLPFSTQSVATTPTLTRTPTPQGAVLLEAYTEANVRGQPDPEAELLGTIRAGDAYPIIGRYFRWYQFQYEQSASGTGWVFDELVQIIGDEAAVRDLTAQEVPTVDVVAQAATETQQIVTQTPGGILTQTASSQIVPLPVQGAEGQLPSANSDTEGEIAEDILPTFTYPPNVAPVPPDNAFKNSAGVNLTTSQAVENPPRISVSEGVPPIAPIVLLGGFGLLGLFITSRRK